MESSLGKAVIHLHTRHSYDSWVSPRSLVNRAIKNGVNVLCITDHDTLKGSLEAEQYALSNFPGKIKIFTGAEYYTDCGDLIALDIKNEIIFENAFDLIDKVHRAGGFVLLPHPYKSHKQVEALAPLCDGIEIFNGRCEETENLNAEKLAQKFSKPGYVASDAHFAADAMDCINYFYTGQMNSFKEILGSIQAKSSAVKYGAKNKIHLSQVIKGIKTKNSSLLFYSLVRFLKTSVS